MLFQISIKPGMNLLIDLSASSQAQKRNVEEFASVVFVSNEFPEA